jgi:hypothetical protein
VRPASARSRKPLGQAVRDVRTAPPAQPADPPADPALATLRRTLDDLIANTPAIGELMLEVAPAYLSDSEAAEVLVLLCEQIGEPLEYSLAARRYAMAGDRRALHGHHPATTAARRQLRGTHHVSQVGGVHCVALRKLGPSPTTWCCSWSW